MPKVAFLTMDVESYYDTSMIRAYQVAANPLYDCFEEMENFASIVEKRGGKATFFVLGDLLERLKEQLKALEHRGHAIGLHSYHHLSPLCQRPEDFEADLQKAQKSYQDIFGKPARGFRAPCFGINEDIRNILERNGILYDSSSLDFHMAYDSGAIDVSGWEHQKDHIHSQKGFYEFQMAKQFHYPISGGAYLRMPPWWFVSLFLRRYLAKSDSFVLYVHPFELSQKKLPFFSFMGLADRMYVNRGRKQYARRIEKIIGLLKSYGYKFPSMEEYLVEENEHV